MARLWHLVLASTMVLALLAGCLQGTPDEGDGTATPGPGGNTMTGTGGPPIGPGAEPIPKRWFANDCKSASIGVNTPGNHPGAEQPPGWEQEVNPYTSLGATVMECDRLSWGPFERGPIYFLYEGHTQLNPPPACTEVDRNTHLRILHSFWVSDEEVAGFLSETYPGMNVRYANFTHETRSGDAGLTENRWTWQEEGGQQSVATILHDGTYDQDIQFHMRYFWWNGSSVSYMNLTEDFRGSGGSELMRSDLNPPMLMADWPLQDPYVGNPQVDVTLTGEIRVFEDLECEQEA